MIGVRLAAFNPTQLSWLTFSVVPESLSVSNRDNNETQADTSLTEEV